MSRATVEEFQKNAAVLLEAVERGEQFVIARGQKAVARLLPAEDEGMPDAEHEEWARAAMANLTRAYGPDEPDYSTAAIIDCRIRTTGHERGSRCPPFAQAGGWES